MAAWEKDPTESIINGGYFQIMEPGPLHAPIQSFSICRDEKLEFVLTTRAPAGAASKAKEFPSGTVRLNTERVELDSIGGVKASFVGVISRRVTIGSDERGIGELREEAKVHVVEGRMPGHEEPKYSIDWLGNVAGHSFHWPDSIRTETVTSITRRLGRDDDTTELNDVHEQVSSSMGAVKLVVSGTEFYLCATSSKPDEDPLKSGCIVYLGTPDDEFRKKIRNCLSFALGVYLVYLGTTRFTKEWRIADFKSISAYSMDRKAFHLVTLPSAPLHPSWQFGIERAILSRIVNAIFAQYDTLKFGDLSWAYWHALGATPHIAAVHFGAAIEALLRRYVEGQPDKFPTKLIEDRAVWKILKEQVEATVEGLSIPEDNRSILLANLGSLNRVPLKTLMDRVLAELGIKLSETEKEAWKRRDDAAHGNEIEPGGELTLIRDNKLLGIIFHRLLLRMTNASDLYFDFCTGGFPTRKLEDPVP